MITENGCTVSCNKQLFKKYRRPTCCIHKKPCISRPNGFECRRSGEDCTSRFEKDMLETVKVASLDETLAKKARDAEKNGALVDLAN